MDKVVPSVLLGGGFIKAKALTSIINNGADTPFWFSQDYGLNLQVTHTYLKVKSESQFSHFYTSVGLMYRFSGRTLKSILWQD
jgi:hypothetical protein